jgi:hypothetical protein
MHILLQIRVYPRSPAAAFSCRETEAFIVSSKYRDRFPK